jgi:hypothetical protein
MAGHAFGAWVEKNQLSVIRVCLALFARLWLRRGEFRVPILGKEPLANTCLMISSPESSAFLKGLPAVMDYATRIHERYFPDYEKWS